jgi:hypothetical protein
MKNENKWLFEVLDVKDLGNGKSEVSLNLSDDFVSWFKEAQGLKRWSSKRFDSWFSTMLREQSSEEVTFQK